MGRLVPFQTAPNPRPRPPDEQGGEARIIVFTGVRYARDEDTPPADKPRRRRRPKRGARVTP